jgi:hypothetical protein
MPAKRVMMDGNEACTSVAYRTSEVISIYPITPASPMGELSDAWSNAGRPNIFGTVPEVIEMQSEAGAAGAKGPLPVGSGEHRVPRLLGRVVAELDRRLPGIEEMETREPEPQEVES